MMKNTFSILLIGIIILSFLVISAPPAEAQSDSLTFAAFGDYGVNNEDEAAVASMVNSWNPDLILALGDDYYLDAGGVGTEKYDLSTGQYYCNFLKDIQTTGTACPVGGASVNRFFPALGDHDYRDAGTSPDSLPSTYLDYFTLPGEGYNSSSGNERYYDFVSGPVHFFILNSLDESGFEPDGTSSTSIQAEWLKTQLGASTSTWNVVVSHKPPFSSGTKHGSTEHIQWPFAEWGADVVFSGDEHNYERVLQNGIVYFVNGLGGAWTYPFGAPIEGSAVRYNASHGAQRVIVTGTSMTFEFYSIEDGGTLRDTYTITVPHATRTPTLPPIYSGWQSPAGQSSVRSNAGDNNGYEVNPVYAFADDGLAAMDIDSGTSASFTCADSTMDKHKFFNYDLSIPSAATVQGIQVRLEANADATAGNPKICVSLSPNGGTSWTAWKSSSTLTNAEASYVLGGTSDTWGRTWLPEELSNTNFQVRVANITSDNSTDFSLDWIAVHVTYTLDPTNTPTATETLTPTPTASQTDTPTVTPTSTVEVSQTDTPTATPSSTLTASPTDTATATPSSTDAASPTVTETASPTGTPTTPPASNETYTPTATETPTHTSTPIVPPVSTFTETNTPTTTATLPTGGANIRVSIGSSFWQTHSVFKEGGLRTSYPAINNGPVKLASSNGIPFVGSEAVIYKVNNIPSSFSEMMGLPNKHLNSAYWFPWYNNKTASTELRIANVSGTTASIHVKIGGTEMVGSPFNVASGTAVTKTYAGIDQGPVKVWSNVKILVSERVIFKVNGVATSYSEMMGLPASQVDKVVWFPWYNNRTASTELRFTNVSTSAASVRVKIGGVDVGSPFNVPLGATVKKTFAGIDQGPVQIISNVNIVASARVVFKVNNVPASYSEMMALPNKQLNTVAWFPYNSKGVSTELRIANVGTAPASVHVLIGGVEVSGSPFSVAKGASIKKTLGALDQGPVKIVSTQKIVVAERLLYKVGGVATSYEEMMALPNSLLDLTYWLPWYNNLDLNTELRLSVP